MRILLSLIILALGVTLLLVGVRAARVLIALWGFLSGLAIGGALISAMSSAPLLGTALGIITGLFFGVFLGVAAYVYYAAAVIITIGMVGYWLGSSFILLFGIQPGFLSTVTGLVLGVVTGIGALLARAPKYVLIGITSVVGAITTVGSIMLLFNVVTVETFSYAATQAAISGSLFWTLFMLALAAVGMVLQSRLSSNYLLEPWTNDERHDTTPHATAVR